MQVLPSRARVSQRAAWPGPSYPASPPLCTGLLSLRIQGQPPGAAPGALLDTWGAAGSRNEGGSPQPLLPPRLPGEQWQARRGTPTSAAPAWGSCGDEAGAARGRLPWAVQEAGGPASASGKAWPVRGELSSTALLKSTAPVCPQTQEAGQTCGKGWGLRQVPAPVPAVGSGSVLTRGGGRSCPGAECARWGPESPRPLPLCSQGRTQPPIPASGRSWRPALRGLPQIRGGAEPQSPERVLPGRGVTGCGCHGAHSHLGALTAEPLLCTGGLCREGRVHRGVGSLAHSWVPLFQAARVDSGCPWMAGGGRGSSCGPVSGSQA